MISAPPQRAWIGPMRAGWRRSAAASPPEACSQQAPCARAGGKRCPPRCSREPRRKGWPGRLGTRLGSRGLPVGSDSPAVHGSQPFSSGRSHRLADATRPLPPARLLRPRPREHQPLRCATECAGLRAVVGPCRPRIKGPLHARSPGPQVIFARMRRIRLEMGCSDAVVGSSRAEPPSRATAD